VVGLEGFETANQAIMGAFEEPTSPGRRGANSPAYQNNLTADFRLDFQAAPKQRTHAAERPRLAAGPLGCNQDGCGKAIPAVTRIATPTLGNDRTKQKIIC
jgi:hypothetical protein